MQLSSLAQMSSEATAVINPLTSVISWLIVPHDMDKLLIVSGLLYLDTKYDNELAQVRARYRLTYISQPFELDIL